MMAIYNAAANNTEYSGAMVAYMLLNNGRDGTYYSSHDTFPLNIFPLLRYIDKIKDDEVLVPIPEQPFNDEKYSFKAIFYDYQYRNKKMNSISLYYFCSQYSKRNAKDLKEDESDLNKERFSTEHEHYKTQYLYKNKKAVVPLIIGPTWPRKTDIDVEKKELYSKMILLVFKPWRQLTNLKDNANSWHEALDAFMASLASNSCILKHINNIEYLKKAKDDANREFEEKLATNSEEISEKDTENIENNVHDEETLHMDSDSDNEENEEEINLSDSENLDMVTELVTSPTNTWVEDAMSIIVKYDKLVVVPTSVAEPPNDSFIQKLNQTLNNNIRIWLQQINDYDERITQSEVANKSVTIEYENTTETSVVFEEEKANNKLNFKQQIAFDIFCNTKF